MRRYDRLELGGQKVRDACSSASGNTVFLSDLTSVEMASAVGRKVRDGEYTREDGQWIWSLFRSHWRDQYKVIHFSPAIQRRSEWLIFTYPLRASDAIHVATAIEEARVSERQLPEFWTADVRQAHAAEAVGLLVTLL
ncbi:MAG: type II toxin-antitoxin system VapC family toxin [Chloroflexota bacterium]